MLTFRKAVFLQLAYRSKSIVGTEQKINMSRQAIAYVCLTIFGAALLVFIWSTDEVTALALTREDGPFEWASAFLWLAGMVVATYQFFVAKERTLVMGFWILFCFLCFGEEISWGQRVFGFSTPTEIREANVQQEFNLHNLAVINPEDRSWALAIAERKFSWGLIASADFLFLCFFFVFFAVCPLAVRTTIGRVLARVGYRTPSGWFAFSVFSILGLSILLVIFGGDEPLRETRELFFALFAVIYLVTVSRRCSND